MFDTQRILSLASAAVITLALSQGVARAAEPAAPAAAAPPAAAPAPAAPAAAADPLDAARAEADARRAQMDAERNKRYEEVRAHAATMGVDLPATPPWANAGAAPDWPAMPPRWTGMSAQDMDKMRAERDAMREKMMKATPEERQAMREQHWKDLRARAAERGIEMPETPPWAAAEQRYKAAQEQFDKYRKIVDAMTPEQVEAARALFGRGGPAMGGNRPRPPMGPGGYGYGPQGEPGYGGYPGGPGPMQPPMMDEEGGMEQAPPPPQGN
jgi:hypothetical protein